MSLTIFAKPQHFFRNGIISHRYPHLYRTSSLVRGEQVAQYLGCKYNPTEGYEDDICIYVKPERKILDDIKDGSYVDIIDDFHYLVLFENRPKINIIFTSQFHYDYFKDNIKNKSVCIPHHHCNFERAVRDRKEIKNVGFIGNKRGLEASVEELEARLGEIGMNFITNYDFKDREDVIDFYKQIDIQLIWKKDNFLSHTPMKLTNASSFGIPTVSKLCDNFKELDGFYITAGDSLDSLIVEIEKLKDQDYYNSWSKKLIPEMERYHIENIVKLYKELK